MPGASDLIPPQAGHQLLSAAEASAAIHAGTLTSEALVSACLERIAQREGEVQAWAFIDPELALAQALAPPQCRFHLQRSPMLLRLGSSPLRCCLHPL